MKTIELDSPARKKGDGRKPGNLLHGWTTTATYSIWNGMKQRCENPNAKVYPYYGGRGITMDPKWKQFLNFLCDMGPRPKGLELDRIDNNGPYCKENCRWATREQQMSNRRCTIRIDCDGERVTLVDACRVRGLNLHSVYMRLDRGWNPIDALNISTEGRHKKCV